ncbi:MAG: P-type conjugative transfer ATPase TrbB [Hyphomonas sp.]|uniref:P-type conjugative transfer ATPase TrbB n=1 Tax=Hyphomonas sp. TaxID=87 RepID=UPI0034A03255
MSAVSSPAISEVRRLSVLDGALGPALGAALADPAVAEILVNADGSVWIDRLSTGLTPTGVQLSANDREAAIRLMAHAAGITVGPDQPRLSASLPGSAARVQAMLPPVVAGPVFAIRKRPDRIHTLDDYVAEGSATPEQVRTLRQALEGRRNIIVAGGAGSGKTTLLNALLAEACMRQSRLIVIEDTEELQVTGANTVQMLTKLTSPEVTLRDLVQDALRLRPDRIIVGEVRSGAALDVLKAWNTGHPGGLLTLHANSAQDACLRLEDLCLEAQVASPRRLIASAVDLIVFIARTASGRRITELLDLKTTTHPTKGDLE